MRDLFVIAALVVAQGACARAGFDLVTCTEDSTSSLCRDEQDPLPGMAWADYVATLAVPLCPEGDVLTVNTVTAELDGGSTITQVSEAGPTLSVIEALQIAANRPGADTVVFDPTVFPVDGPQRILVQTGGHFVLDGDCIDGRGAGVVLEWPASGALAMNWVLSGALVVGLTFLRVPSLGMLNPNVGSQIAGCRFNTDGEQSEQYFSPTWAISGSSGVVGPGNVFGALNTGIHAYPGMIIRENFFGVDPVTGTEGLFSGTAIQTSHGDPPGTIEIADNVFVQPTHGIYGPFGSSSITLTIRGNAFRERAGYALGSIAIELHGYRGTIGPDNHIFGLQAFRGAILLDDGYLGSNAMAITANSIHDNLTAIGYPNGAPLGAPILTGWDGATLTGNCPVAGKVEIFRDRASQGESYLGTVDCDSAAPFAFALMRQSLPGGEWNATATLTNTTPETSLFSAPLPLR